MAVLTALTVGTPMVGGAASPPAVRGTGGAVVTEHTLATEAGLEILRHGGNAVDATVAAALALAVVFPEAGNLGGGGFVVIRMQGEATEITETGETAEPVVSTLDFRETAPAAATADMYLDEAGEPIREKSLVGPLAAGVPGSPHGYWELHRRFGALPWGAVVEPARRLASQGFEVDRHLATMIAQEQSLLRRFPETARIWLPEGRPPVPGTVVRLPELARTLAAYAEQGPEAITTGPVAAAVEAASRRYGGVLTAGEMAGYESVWREPVRFEAFGWQFAAMGLPSSSGIIVGQGLKILEAESWGRLPRFGADRHHLLAEVLRRSYVDRLRLGDPATTEARPEDLLDPAWLRRLASSLDRTRAADSRQLEPWAPTAARQLEAQLSESTETTHLSVVDGAGNLVSMTTTLNGYFGCGLYVPEAGFFLNNEMDDFAAAPGRPNLYGLIQGRANAVGAGKRMLSSMGPTLAWRAAPTASSEDGDLPTDDSGNDEPVALALGARGGSRIPTQSLQVLLNLLVDGDGLQAALDRPRLHHQWLPDRLFLEADAASPETRAALAERGHELEVWTKCAKVQAVQVLSDGVVEAAADPRSTGVAGVVRPTP